MAALICQPSHPEGKFLADWKFYPIGKDKGIGDVGHLFEEFVGASDLDGGFAIDDKVALASAIFHSVVDGQLVDKKTLTNGANLLSISKCIEHIGVVQVYLVGFLQPRDGVVVGIEQVKQFGATKAVNIR